MSQLRVFTFFPAFGLPTGGPFALKLLKWLDIGGIDYEQVIENDSGKGPNKKNPWVELDGERIPDSEIIIDRLTHVYGFDIDAGLEPSELGRLHAFRRMIEEHLHMVFEWEMFVHPNGRPFVVEVARSMAPRPLAGMAATMVCRQLGKQLHARGIARHDDNVIARKGIADVVAIEVALGDKAYLAGERPSLTDVSAYGMMQPMARWPMSTPVADYIKSRPLLCDWLNRIENLTSEKSEAA
ncbi:glutathione S-transferase C-terminal domain-containing protein [Mesorhizobium sp. YIM 152430]|uniref:glutathione S-transferase C-terminal domain-containing protein n=1 Tax=Mesorhizobium sp. YIM 152430 TaxID=3031761 RepID=UPI0023D9EA1A|nr:glutathione S-transferase C-terminal domain-containing protein [Mesorhizobium sp. YIM 152430]MDF1601901.1 glutathione S-transferase C-terminal domain-containing protein [Mesorhizobium sp. YIM 152430]